MRGHKKTLLCLKPKRLEATALVPCYIWYTFEYSSYGSSCCVSHIFMLVCLSPSWAAAHHHSSVAQLSHRLPFWRELPHDVWSQRESRARVSTEPRFTSDGKRIEEFVSSPTRSDNKQRQQFTINMCLGALVWNFKKWAWCSRSWKTWHLHCFSLCRFRWTKNGQEFDPFLDPRLMKEEDSGTFVIPNNGNLTVYQGIYRCYASNRLGTAISKEIEFIVPRE